MSGARSKLLAGDGKSDPRSASSVARGNGDATVASVTPPGWLLPLLRPGDMRPFPGTAEMPSTLQDTSGARLLPAAGVKLLDVSPIASPGCIQYKSVALMTPIGTVRPLLECGGDAATAAFAWLASSVTAAVDAGGEHATSIALLGSSCKGDTRDIAGERATSSALASVATKLGSGVSSPSEASAGWGGASVGKAGSCSGASFSCSPVPVGLRNVARAAAEGWLSQDDSLPQGAATSPGSTVELKASVPVSNATGVLTVDPVGICRLRFVCRPLDPTESRRPARIASSNLPGHASTPKPRPLRLSDDVSQLPN
jgi:hypothetical protein